MGNLVTRETLFPSPAWYFEDARYYWEKKTWIYTWPNKSFPVQVAIHQDDVKDYNDRKISIRRWVTANVQGTVIVDEVDKSYRVYFSEDRHWDRSYERTNIWVVFYFETEDDALMFRLAFSEYVKEMTDLHPTRNDEYEKTSYCKTYK